MMFLPVDYGKTGSIMNTGQVKTLVQSSLMLPILNLYSLNSRSWEY